MKAAVRVYSLTLGGTGPKSLPGMERHGKRQDRSSQRRRVRNAAPLVYGSLDLREAYDTHVDGCRMNKGLKRPVMHAVVQFPPELAHSEKNRRTMLAHAVRFINETHGGHAVFAARLDQDEEGLGAVDVFFTPKYEKRTKRAADMWISTSKHGKELAEKHRSEIERRHNGRFSTGPRQVGIALQAELYDYLGRKGLKLEPRVLKDIGPPDRIEPEEYRAREQAAKLVREAEEEVARVRRGAESLRRLLGALAERLGIKTSNTVRVALERIEQELMGPPRPAPEDPFVSASEDPRQEAGPGL